MNDFITLEVWGMLAVSGFTLQIQREGGQQFFLPYQYKLWKCECEPRVTNNLDPNYHILPLRESHQKENTPASVNARQLGQYDLEVLPSTTADLVFLPRCFSNLWGKSAKKPAFVSALYSIVMYLFIEGKGMPGR